MRRILLALNRRCQGRWHGEGEREVKNDGHSESGVTGITYEALALVPVDRLCKLETDHARFGVRTRLIIIVEVLADR